MRTVGIKIKDSDENVCTHTESFTMTVPESMPQTFATGRSSPASPSVHTPVFINGTKLIKPISSALKIEDSGSEFCAPSIASTTKTCSFSMTDSVNASNVLMEAFEDKKRPSSTESPSKILKLSCGPVKIHSYRDSQVSEDVVYQGEWQKCKLKAIIRKKNINFSTSRSRVSSVVWKSKEILREKKVSSKEKLYRKRQEKKQMEAGPIKVSQIPKFKPRKVIQDEKSAEKKPRVSKSGSKIPNKCKGIPRPIKTVTKVMTKTKLSKLYST